LLQTVDSTPNGGGHCWFDGKWLVSGVQLMASNYANVMGTDASGLVMGIGNVLTVGTPCIFLQDANELV
jgi:hypothetical protein